MVPFFEFLGALSLIIALGIGGFFLNVLLHELGHAIPILLWSQKKTGIYIGSFGDPRKSLRLPLGRLVLYLKYNPFLWYRGMCKPGERLSVPKTIIYTAMGPLVSLLITGTCYLMLKTVDRGHDQTVVLVTLMVIGGILTLSSAIPNNKLTLTFSGGIARNDATQIVQLWKTRNMPMEYQEAINMLREKDYAGAVALLEAVIGQGHANVELYRLASGTHLMAGDYARARELMDLIRRDYRVRLEDEINEAVYMTLMGRHRQAVALNGKLLELHFNNFLLLNNMSYSLIAVGEAEKALDYANRGITLAPKFAHLYCTRGWARMELGQWEEGLEDARHAQKLDKKIAHAYRLFGLYELNSGHLEEAKTSFLEARSLDPRIQFVDEHLIEIERRLMSSSV
ncbi:MAG TPA: tetratricopeptide repeat protein [Puia sp.]|nr:tetratricopeptide repeat protein [Puia sp.]